MTAVEPNDGAEDPVLESQEAASSSKSKAQARISLGSQGSRALSASLTTAITIGGFAYGGYLLDESWGVAPLFVLLGAAVGGLGGFLYLVKEVSPESLPWTSSSGGEASEDGGADSSPASESAPPGSSGQDSDQATNVYPERRDDQGGRGLR